jgi:hypothetical protein
LSYSRPLSGHIVWLFAETHVQPSVGRARAVRRSPGKSLCRQRGVLNGLRAVVQTQKRRALREPWFTYRKGGRDALGSTGKTRGSVVPDPGVSPLGFPRVNVRCHARLDSAKKAWPGGKDSSHFGRRADRVPGRAGGAFQYGLRLLGAAPFSRLVSPTGATK